MSVIVENMTSEVTVMDGDLPLSDAQLERLVKLVIQRLEAQQREARRSGEATQLRRESAPPSVVK